MNVLKKDCYGFTCILKDSEAVSVIQVKGDTGPNHSGSKGDGEKWSDSGYIYKEEFIEFPDVLGRRYAIERDKDVQRKHLILLARVPGKVLPPRMARAVGRADYMAMWVNHEFCLGHVKSYLPIRHLSVFRCHMCNWSPEFVGNIHLGIGGNK